MPKIAGLAAPLAMLPSALAVLVQQAGGLRELVPILALIVLVTLAVFAWGVPAALGLDAPGPSQVAMALSGLGVLTLLLFWTGLPALLATGGIVLGGLQLDVPATVALRWPPSEPALHPSSSTSFLSLADPV